MQTVTCEQCEIQFKKSNAEIRRTKHNFCCNSCFAKYNNPRRKKKRYCDNCGNLITGMGKKYCSNTCAQEHIYRKFIDRWLQGKETGKIKGCGVSRYIHRWIRKTQGEKCSICEWSERNPHTGSIPVHLDHIDGDWENNRPENLRLLCPNCHSLTSTYGGANRGNGRPFVVYKKEL